MVGAKRLKWLQKYDKLNLTDQCGLKSPLKLCLLWSSISRWCVLSWCLPKRLCCNRNWASFRSVTGYEPYLPAVTPLIPIGSLARFLGWLLLRHPSAQNAFRPRFRYIKLSKRAKCDSLSWSLAKQCHPLCAGSIETISQVASWKLFPFKTCHLCRECQPYEKSIPFFSFVALVFSFRFTRTEQEKRKITFSLSLNGIYFPSFLTICFAA